MGENRDKGECVSPVGSIILTVLISARNILIYAGDGTKADTENVVCRDDHCCMKVVKRFCG